MSWASGLSYPVGLAINGNFMYVTNDSNGTITQLNLTTGSIVNSTWVTGLNGPVGLVINGNFMYVTNYNNGTITQLNLANGSIVNSTWATGLNGPLGLVINENFMYVANVTNGTITQLNLEDGSPANSTWATGLNSPAKLAINGNFMYVANVTNGTITQLNLEDGSPANSTWATGLSYPYGLVINGNFMYVTNYDNGTITQLNLEDGSLENSTWATGLSYPYGLVINGNFMYVTNYGNGTIARFDLPIIANICFPKGTPVLTDQGLIAIDEIDIQVNTIDQKKIIDITKTVSKETFLVCFEKDALGLDMPSQQTIISPGHTLLYEGEMHPAKWFLEKFLGVKSIPYTGEPLYNFLLEKHDVMNVNNLICETLLPDNPISKFYTKQCKLSQENRDIMVNILKGCLDRNDIALYNQILECC